MQSDKTQDEKEISAALHEVVKDLTDFRKWKRTDMCARERAAEDMLKLLSEKGLIEHRKHPMGGDVWRIGNALYGRTDSITNENFEKLKRS